MKLVKGVISDDQLPFALLAVTNLHRRAQALGQALLESGDIRIRFGGFDRCRFAAEPLAHQRFSLTYGQASCDNVSRPFNLLISGKPSNARAWPISRSPWDNMVLITSGSAIKRNKLTR